MSDLSDLAADMSKDLPPSVRKVIDTAVDNGWELNPPGMTLCLRLNKTDDDLAQPVYITWVVGRTPKGKLSFRFMSCGTAGLIPLSGADLLEYLADVTTAYLDDEDIAEIEDRHDDRLRPKWNDQAPVEVNVANRLGGKVTGVVDESKPRRKTFEEIQAEQKARIATRQQFPVSSGLRVQAPKA